MPLHDRIVNAQPPCALQKAGQRSYWDRVRWHRRVFAPCWLGLFVAIEPIGTLVAAPSSEGAPSPPATVPTNDEAGIASSVHGTDEAQKAESRRHFQSGISLYEDHNYTAALAEFEAAYRQFPSASALQNVALCQKQLYRYSEARESLARLLRDHWRELDTAERAAVDNAVAELGALIGSVQLTVSPADAKLVLDGRSISPEERLQPIVLDVGEHRVSAEAPGFASISRAFRIAGGHVEVPIALVLTETSGVVTVTAPDAQTAIAIDGRPVAFAEWSGRLDPGRHIVQVYREGFEPFEEEIDVEVGSKTVVKGVLGDRTESAGHDDTNPDKTKRSQTGIYGLGAVGVFVPRGHPLGFDADSNYNLGWLLGVRAGYRLMTALGVEAQVDSAEFAVNGHCTTLVPSACPTLTSLSYHLDARHVGAAVRLFSSSETFRLTLLAGGGAVSHDLRFGNFKAAGLDPYFSLEGGLQINWRHSLWEIVATAQFDGAASIHVGDYRPYAEANGIQMYGLGLRVGWGEWQPTRPPLPPMPAQRPTPPK